jgi:hypothetical protein
MKKFNGFLACFFLAMLVFHGNAFAQAEQKFDHSFYVGSWDVMGKDIPDGNDELLITFEQKENKWVGSLKSKKHDFTMPFNNVRIDDTDIIGEFNYDGNDIFILLRKKGDNEVEGNIANMFDVSGKRSK